MLRSRSTSTARAPVCPTGRSSVRIWSRNRLEAPGEQGTVGRREGTREGTRHRGRDAAVGDRGSAAGGLQEDARCPPPGARRPRPGIRRLRRLVREPRGLGVLPGGASAPPAAGGRGGRRAGRAAGGG